MNEVVHLAKDDVSVVDRGVVCVVPGTGALTLPQASTVQGHEATHASKRRHNTLGDTVLHEGDTRGGHNARVVAILLQASYERVQTYSEAKHIHGLFLKMQK